MSRDFREAAATAEQAGARPPVWVECGCGHDWQSRAKDRMTIHCPRCGTGVRTPYRTRANTGTVPEGRLPAPVRPAPAPPPPRPARARPEPRWLPEEAEEDQEEDDEPPRAGMAAWFRNGGREEILRLFAPAPAPAACPAPRPQARPAPARRSMAPPAPAPAPRQAPGPVAPPRAAPAPVDPATLNRREVDRRDTVCQIVRSLGGPLLVWYNQPPGHCEALDTAQAPDAQRCPGGATHAVRYRQGPTEAHAYSCAAHARPLANIADRSAVVRATVYPLR
ncbi:hypothetical protein [Streptomyces sp. NPDC056491]|uniref:hypothetical protein n=1 Tax=Streptomyces sp. NPDC056491 TaxID=3345837 RepID=UPI00368E85AF